MSDELYDGMFDGIMKTFLAQLNSSLKISKIISEHSGEGELSEDSIISGLVYRLMTPMEDGDVKESMEIADDIYNKYFMVIVVVIVVVIVIMVMKRRLTLKN